MEIACKHVEITVGEKPKARESEPSQTAPEEDSNHSVLWTKNVAVLLPKSKLLPKKALSLPKREKLTTKKSIQKKRRTTTFTEI